MTTRLVRHFSGLLLALGTVAVVAVAGCSRGVEKMTVQGTITYQGQPVPSGMLKVVGPEGSGSGGPIQDGKFIVTDVVPGEVKVGVVETPQSSRREGSSNQQPMPPVSLPEHLRDPETSGLKYTITPRTKELKIDIP